MGRTAEIRRKTRETDIVVRLNLDGSGNADVQTGIGFFDHMLDGFARHGLFDLKLHAKGDLAVDCHHTVEDTGIVLGSSIREALGEKEGICRGCGEEPRKRHASRHQQGCGGVLLQTPVFRCWETRP